VLCYQVLNFSFLPSKWFPQNILKISTNNPNNINSITLCNDFQYLDILLFCMKFCATLNTKQIQIICMWKQSILHYFVLKQTQTSTKQEQNKTQFVKYHLYFNTAQNTTTIILGYFKKLVIKSEYTEFNAFSMCVWNVVLKQMEKKYHKYIAHKIKNYRNVYSLHCIELKI
jgi:hypothetical protein